MYFSCSLYFIIILLVWPQYPIDAYYYCGEDQKKLCNPNIHFLCNISVVPIGGTFKHLCPMTRKLKNLILERHNFYRNKIAGGKQEIKDAGMHPKAIRMREVLWSDELAYIAGEHTKRCGNKHDKCRSIAQYRSSGQNIYKSYSIRPLNLTDEIIRGLFGWWHEVFRDKKWPEGNRWHTLGYYSMANERTAHVGCGLSLCENCGRYKYCVQFTCNYALSNIHGLEMYKSGKNAASNCNYYGSTPSMKYKNLCINTGKVFNKYY